MVGFFFKIISISDMMPVLLPSSTTVKCRICYDLVKAQFGFDFNGLKAFGCFLFSEASIILNNQELDYLSSKTSYWPSGKTSAFSHNHWFDVEEHWEDNKKKRSRVWMCKTGSAAGSRTSEGCKIQPEIILSIIANMPSVWVQTICFFSFCYMIEWTRVHNSTL